MKFNLITKLFLPLSVFTFMVSSCGEDEEPLHTDPEPTLEVQRQETTQSISNGDSKTWRISNAVLTNDSGTFDISENFNVKDDEFIFKADQT
ncbi:MAG: hypothetical protein HKN48_09955, partial [Flavobacteriaceae bacterium]|nr:hypothetical protein [Flavobacteriaceae bacterium]